jgi:uncharacterized membrane protein
MIPYRMIALVLVVALLLTAVTPARAEAMEIGTILLLVGVGVAVVILIAFLIIANVADRQRAEVPADQWKADGTPLVLVTYLSPPAQSP